MAITNNSVGTDFEAEKNKCYQRRIDENSWKASLMYLFPPFGLIHASTRNTVTPFLFSMIGSGVAFLFLSSFAAALNPDITAQQKDRLNTSTWLITAPLFAKLGMSQAKADAKKRLGL